MQFDVIPFGFSVLNKTPRKNFLGGSFEFKPIQSVCYDSRNRKYIVGFSDAYDPEVSTLVRMTDLVFDDDHVDLVNWNVRLYHCNDLVYDPGRHLILAATGEKWVGVVDPETLTVVGRYDLAMYAWSMARYPSGNIFVHDGETGCCYDPFFENREVVSTGDRAMIKSVLDNDGVWQGATMIDGVPYMMFNEIVGGNPKSLVLMSCCFDERTIYRAETGFECESICLVDGKMKIALGNYKIGSGEWEMAEVLMKMVTGEIERLDIPAGKEIKVDCSGFVPAGYKMMSANANFKNGGTTRALPFIGNDGACILRILRVDKTKIILKSGKAYSDASLMVVAFCRKE